MDGAAAPPRLTAAPESPSARSEAAGGFCVQPAFRDVGVGSDGVCASLEEAAEDKAMADSAAASEGVVGGVWKKSRGETEREGGGKNVPSFKISQC